MSPVIGVILMVAITVILAAVIGTFVLGLGDSLGDNQPTAQLSVENASSSTDLDVSHSGGDSIDQADLEIVAYNGDTAVDPSNVDNDARTKLGSSGTISVGDSVSVSYSGTGTNSVTVTKIKIIHTPSDSIILDRNVEINNFHGWD
nr:type IV pilin N-terminal domain-containing protein [Halorubrum yunnanense]